MLRLRQRALEGARLEGALLVARTTAHAINNALSPVQGFGELLTLHPAVRADAMLLAYAENIVRGADLTAEHVRRLQRIVRLEEDDTFAVPQGAVLDLERSSATDEERMHDVGSPPEV
jgi:hypothetical protein